MAGSSTNKTNNIGLFSAYRNLSNVIQAPKAILFYGGWGVLPFILIPIYLVITGTDASQLSHANVSYGAIILTFLGAVRWGLAIPNSKDKSLKPNFFNMGVAVTPSVLGWISHLVSQVSGTRVILGGFVMCIIQDAYSLAYPPWYKSFRIIFSTIAALSIATTLLVFVPN